MRGERPSGADQPSLLAIFAHPDDESVACGGLLARCSDMGVRVSLLCLTHGEHGPGADSGRLREMRARELTDAAGVLGITETILLDLEDGMLPWMDATALESVVRDAIHRLEPDVVLTFDEDGLYWHPDHVAVCASVTSVIAALGTNGPALYHVSIPRGTMRAVVEASRADPACGTAPSPTVLGIEEVDAFGWNAPAPTLIVDAGPHATRKVAAIRCHRSQVEGTVLDCLDEREAGLLLGTEHFRRAEVGAAGETFLDRLGSRADAVTGVS